MRSRIQLRAFLIMTAIPSLLLGGCGTGVLDPGETRYYRLQTNPAPGQPAKTPKADHTKEARP
jgi:hypothetical protein